MALKAPEITLSPQEGEALAQAIANVSALYDVTGGVSPEVMAWLHLAQVAGFVYGPRIVAARARKAMARAQAQAEANGEWHYGQEHTGAQGNATH